MMKVFVGAGKVLPGMASRYTTETPFPPLTFPVMSPPLIVRHAAVMRITSLRNRESIWDGIWSLPS